MCPKLWSGLEMALMRIIAIRLLSEGINVNACDCSFDKHHTVCQLSKCGQGFIRNPSQQGPSYIYSLKIPDLVKLGLWV